MTNKIIKQNKHNNNKVTITKIEKTKASKTFAIHNYPFYTTIHKHRARIEFESENVYKNKIWLCRNLAQYKIVKITFFIITRKTAVFSFV